MAAVNRYDTLKDLVTDKQASATMGELDVDSIKSSILEAMAQLKNPDEGADQESVTSQEDEPEEELLQEKADTVTDSMEQEHEGNPDTDEVDAVLPTIN